MIRGINGQVVADDYSKYEQLKFQREVLRRINDLEAQIQQLKEQYNGNHQQN